MRKIVAHFIKFPFYANMFIVILLIGGGLSFLSLKKSFFPERSEQFINISVFYPGASPKEMEEGITTRIEESVRGLIGIKEVNSTSSENFSFVSIEITGEYDIDEILVEVKNAVDGISSFPVDAERPVVSKLRPTSLAAYMGLTGNVDKLTLKKLASDIEDDLLNSGIISKVNITGYPAIEISVEVTEEDLLRYSLTFDEISVAIRMNNADISAGMIRSDKEEILIRSRARTTDPAKIGEIIIRANDDGSKLFLRDIADIKLKFADVPSTSLMNGKPSVSLLVMKLPDEDLKAISKFLNNYVKEFNRTHNNVELIITYDFLEMLNSRLNLLYKNGGIGLFLVLVTLGLFLSLRLSFWVAWGIPASFLGMFILANIYGITINMISLMGMILVIGILVDDGIVIAENIYTHFEKGKSPKRAALDGTMEVMPAVITSVSTTIVAFSPLFFLHGRMEFMYDVGFVIVVSLIVSLFEAFFVLPAHLSSNFILRVKDREGGANPIRKALDKAVSYIRDRIYGKLMRFTIRWKRVIVIIPIALIFITVGLFGGGFIKATFFPSIPFDQFTVNIAFTPGTGEAQTLEYLKRFDDAIWEVNDELMEQFNDTVPFINFTFLGLGNAFDGNETGAHAGNIFVIVKNLDECPVSSYEVVNRVREKIGPVNEAEKFAIGGRVTFGTPISISLLGKSLEELEQAKHFLKSRMENIPTLRDIVDNNAIGKREVQLELKPKAYFLGLNRYDIANQVRQGFFGGQAQRLQIGKDEVRVWVRYPKQDRISLGQLENMKIKTRLGEFPLNELAGYKISRGPVNIRRYNGQREVRIESDLVDPLEPVPAILEQINTEIVPELQRRFPGIDIKFLGQSRDSDESLTDMIKYFSIALVIMILIIMIHFKSASQAIIILMMIPLAWMGAAWGHGIEGIPFSMLSAWGMVALSGVIINDAVIFLAKYNKLLQEGLSVANAAYKAGLARFRAIILTTLTTTLGLYPIILEKSFQAQFLKPMAVSLAYGVAFGTLFILFFFPALIITLNDLRVFFTRIFRWIVKNPDSEFFNYKSIIPTREEVEPAIRHIKKTIE